MEPDKHSAESVRDIGRQSGNKKNTSVGPADGPSGPVGGLGKRRARKAVLIGIAIVACVVGVTTASAPAWRETQLREAYLPDLEAQAARQPNDGPLLAVLGARLAESGQHQAAVQAMTRATQLGENNPSIWLTIAGQFAIAGDRQGCVNVLQHGEQTLGDSSTQLQDALEQAQQASSFSNPGAFAMGVDPVGPQALVDAYTGSSFLNGLADWWGRGHPDDSGFETRAQMAAQSPNDPEALRLWGLALIENDRISQAVATLQRAYVLSPKSPDIDVGMAQALDAAGDHQSASGFCVQALLLRPGFVPALLALGEANFNMGRGGIATAAFELAAKLEPTSAEAWVGAGRSAIMSDDYADAVQAFETALRLEPDRTDFTDDYAHALNLDRQYARAEAVLRPYLADHPQDATADVELGGVLLSSDPTPQRLAEAEADTRAGIRLEQNWYFPDQQLGQLLIREGQPAQAVSALRDAYALRPNNAVVWRLMARAYQAAGQPALATVASRREAQEDELEQKLEQLQGEEFERYLDPGYHRQMIALFELGHSDQADQERTILQQIQSDPKGFAGAWEKENANMAKVLQTTEGNLFRIVQ